MCPHDLNAESHAITDSLWVQSKTKTHVKQERTTKINCNL